MNRNDFNDAMNSALNLAGVKATIDRGVLNSKFEQMQHMDSDTFAIEAVSWAIEMAKILR